MSNLNHRYIARVVLEAETALFVGSGEASLLTDALVQKDNHGFPMIQGTSLTGVLRHSIEDVLKNKEDWQSFFGYQASRGKKGLGSQLKVSSAYLVIENGKVAEGLEISESQKNKAHLFNNLPVRQHVRITDKGVAKEHGLFDNEVVFKGARFLFELELKGNESDTDRWNELLSKLQSEKFRMGQGTRNGYGRLKVRSLKSNIFDLDNVAQFNAYLDFNPSLNAENSSVKEIEKATDSSGYLQYTLELKPDDFFIFGAGYGDTEVDNVPVTEQVLTYNEKESLESLQIEGLTLIPATSIKGALSHRTAFHYNKLKGNYADRLAGTSADDLLEANNKAVYSLFGAEEGHKNVDGKRGSVIINDELLAKNKVSNDKIFNHVAIDRFTGGAMNGALFSEKVSYFNNANDTFNLTINVEENQSEDEDVLKAFENALEDICSGLLPLGGMITKGHGMFTGKLYKNNEEIFSYE